MAKKKTTLTPGATVQAFPESTHPLANCEPLDDRVVVKRDSAKHTSNGGIIIPNMAATKTQLATVIAVGPGAYRPDGTRMPMPVKVGDRVIVAPYAALEVIDPSASSSPEEYAILRTEDILARLRS